jgi:catalase
VLAAAGIDSGHPGVVLSAGVDKAFLGELTAALGLHRVWERAQLVMASAAPS